MDRLTPKRLLPLTATCLFAVVASAAAGEPREPGLLFHTSFDKRDVAADFAVGKPESTTFNESLELRGVEGISGPGFKLSQGERLDYEMAGNFDVRCGSVSLWVQPVNWSGDVKRFHHFFVAQCPGVFNFYIYRYCQPTHLFFYISVGKRKVIARTPTNQWRPGQWHKIDATWDAQRMRLYVDSVMESETTIPDDFVLPQRNDGFISITPIQFWKSFCSPDDRTIVDEVKVHGRVLTPAEIRRDYVRLAGQLAQGEAKPVDMICRTDSHAGVVRVQLDAFGMGKSAGTTLSAQVCLEDSAGKAIVRRSAAMGNATASIALPCDTLPPGKYKVVAVVSSQGGRRTETVSAAIERPATPWQKPMPQYEHVVPDPWSPVEGDERRVDVWGRTYEFDAGPLPRAIASQGEAVLARPIRLGIDVGNGTENPKWQAASVSDKHPDALVRSGRGHVGDLALTYSTRVEFDGMLRCDLDLDPQRKLRIDALRLDLPIAAAHGRFVHTHRLQPWQGETMDMDFHECLWLTGYHLGLCWFAESDANWVHPPGAKPIHIRRGRSGTTLTVHFISSPVEIRQPVRYTFGIQATPVRKLPANWRSLNLGGYGKIRGSTAQTTAWGGGCLKMSAYLEPWREDIMRRVCKKYRDMGSPSLPYSTPTYMSDHNPIFDFYHMAWRNTSGHKYVGYKHRDGFKYSMVAICPASDYSKLMAYWVENLSRDYDIGGIYFDCCSPDRCTNTRHGCGGTDAFGKRFQTNPIFGLRRVLKQVYTILHGRGKILINHAHSRFYPPCHAFSDYWYPGEQFTAALGRNIWHYCDGIPREVWQVELSARTKGVGVSFLPEYGRGTDKKYRDVETKPSRSLLASCVVHDVPVSASWIHLGELQKVWDVYGKFHLSAARFFPYWEECPVQVDAPLLASVYQLPKSAVVMVSNLTPKPAQGMLRIDAQTLAIPGGHTLRDECTGRALSAELGAIPVAVPERDYTILSVTW